MIELKHPDSEHLWLIALIAMTYVGKESNHLEDVESGLMHTADSVYAEYLIRGMIRGQRSSWR